MKIHSLKSDPFGKKQIFQKYSTNTEAQSVRTEQKNSLYISGQVRILWTVNDMAGKDPLGVFPASVGASGLSLSHHWLFIVYVHCTMYIHEVPKLLGFQIKLILNLQFMVFDAVIVFDAR